MKDLPLRILISERIKDVKIKQFVSTMSENVYVNLDDPVEKALEFMINMDIGTIPVVDENNNIIDDVTLSEILLKILL